MSLDYIRDHYGVPAHKGAVVEYQGKRGVVTSASGPHVRVRMDGERMSKPYHPMDLTYVKPESAR